MALVSVTLCVERINFIFKRWNGRAKKSSLSWAPSRGSVFRANFLASSAARFIIRPQMAQGLHLSQRLAQSLVLSPQLQHSLALLQAPTLELKALVEHELEQNPVLEEVAAPETDFAEK